METPIDAAIGRAGPAGLAAVASLRAEGVRAVVADKAPCAAPRTMDDAQVKRAVALRRSLSVREVARRMRLPKSTVDRALRAL